MPILSLQLPMVPRTRMMGMTAVYGNRHVDRNLICKKFHNEKKPIVLFNRYTLMKVLITNIRNLIIIGAEYQIGSNIIPVLSFSMHGKKKPYLSCRPSYLITLKQTVRLKVIVAARRHIVGDLPT